LHQNKRHASANTQFPNNAFQEKTTGSLDTDVSAWIFLASPQDDILNSYLQ